MNKNNQLKTNQYIKVLLDISLSMVNFPLDKLDDAVNHSLKEVATVVDAHRAYIFDYDFEMGLAKNTYEWCAAGIKPNIDSLQAVPIKMFEDIASTHKFGEHIDIEDVSKLKNTEFRKHLEEQNIYSLLAVPLMKEGVCIGFAGLDRCIEGKAFSKDDHNMMKLFSELLINVCQRLENERRLIEKQEEFKAIFDYSKDGIAIIDMQSNFIDFNNAYLEMIGYTRDELLEKSWIGMSVSEDIPRAIEALKIAQKDGFYKDFHKSSYKKDGSLIDTNVSISLMPDKKRVLLTLKDITENIKIVKSLKTAKNEADVLFMDSPIPMGFVRDGKSVRMNNAFIEMTGYTEEDIKTPEDWFLIAYPDEEYRKEVYEKWGAAFSKAQMGNGKMDMKTYTIVCKNGAKKDVTIGGFIIGSSYIVSFIDSSR